MVDILEIAAGSIIARTPAGVEKFNSADRMPASLATIDLTGSNAVTLDFPMTAYESTTGGGSLQTTIAAHTVSTPVTLQAYTPATAPTFFIGEVKLVRTLAGKSGSGTGTLGTGVFESTWLPYQGGSLYIEGSGAVTQFSTGDLIEWLGPNQVSGHKLSRWIEFGVSGGNVVVYKKQMSAGLVSAFYAPPVQSTHSTWSLECRLICGFFDL